MNRGKRLQLWAGHESAKSEDQVPRPVPSDVLYARPNPDRTQKMCANCFMWQGGRDTCMIHDPSVIVIDRMVCGYHVYGQPQAQGVSLAELDPVDPELSGLIATEEGSVCSNCKHFRPLGQTQGQCVAVADPDSVVANAVVEPMGCCTRWRQKY